MPTRLDKSEPTRLAFRLIRPPGAIGTALQVAQDFSVVIDVMAGETEHARYRSGEAGLFSYSEVDWPPGTRFAVLAERDVIGQRRRLLAVPAGDADYHLGLPIGGFTIGDDGHPDPASAWDIAAPAGVRQLPPSEWTFQSFDGFIVVGAWASGNARHYRRVPVPLQGEQQLVGWADLERAILEARDDEPVRNWIGDKAPIASSRHYSAAEIAGLPFAVAVPRNLGTSPASTPVEPPTSDHEPCPRHLDRTRGE